MNHDSFACLEAKAVILLESRPNADSAAIQAHAALCLTAPVMRVDDWARVVDGHAVDAVIFNDVLTETPRACAGALAVAGTLKPGACFMICESYWAIDTGAESLRMQALFGVRHYARHVPQLPLWQRGQLYSIMQGFGLERITFAPTPLDSEASAEWVPERHRTPLSKTPADRIHYGRMRMWGFKPER